VGSLTTEVAALATLGARAGVEGEPGSSGGAGPRPSSVCDVQGVAEGDEKGIGNLAWPLLKSEERREFRSAVQAQARD
jgi:hypothetical protein